MSEAVIRAEGLGKRYRIGEREAGGLLRDKLGRALRSPLGVFRRKRREEFWALKGVNLEVHEGEVLGLIGRNGAGKTTLLKILSRITRPTTGWAEVRGHVGSLLEVGTGFHPELTGRENTYLSGAILGMKKSEIERKFDEIVAFAEIEKFIDTPVKHYSSGMYVRLAFAVAAHLEPEILLVDEVLAVGDAAFQRKCMGKMGDVSRAGRTVIFVSHNIGAINALCSRTILLREGEVGFDGPTTAATERYYREVLQVSTNGSCLKDARHKGSGKAHFSSIVVQAQTSDGKRLAVACPGCDLRIELEIESQADVLASNVAVIIYDGTGYRLVDVNTAQKGSFVNLKAGQRARAEFRLRELQLKPGTYFVSLWLGRDAMEEIDSVENATSFEFAQSSETARHSVVFPGPYLCRFEESVSIF